MERTIHVCGHTLKVNLTPYNDGNQFYYIERTHPNGRHQMDLLYSKADLSELSNKEIIDKYESQIEIITV